MQITQNQLWKSTFMQEMDFLALEGNSYNSLFLPILSVLTIISLYLFISKRADSRLHLPPGPFAWPFIGNILDLDSKNTHKWLTNLAGDYGPLFSLKLGPKVLVVASSPAAAEEILRTRDRDLSGRFKSRLIATMPEFQSSVIVLSTECSEKWRVLRKNAHVELFSTSALEMHAKTRAQKAREMLDLLVSKEGEAVEIANVIYSTVVNMLTNALMSKDLVENLDSVVELKRFSRKLIGFAVPGMADLYPGLGALFDFETRKTALEYKEKSRAIWGDIVSERRGKKNVQEAGAPGKDFLDVLIRNSFDDGEIYNVFSELFVTSDSISTTMEWAIAELTRNQEALSLLRDEITETINDGSIPTESQLSKLPYLQACIKETLRLHPPSPFLVPHCSLRTCKVMNYDVPKDSLVVVNAYAVGRDPGAWDDPSSFKPERFLEGKNNIDLKGTHYGLLPFGGGRRMCVGIPLALKQIQLLLALLVYAFDWFLPSGTEPSKLDMSEKYSIPLGRAEPLHLNFKKRTDLKFEP